jgi:hypothetical protein
MLKRSLPWAVAAFDVRGTGAAPVPLSHPLVLAERHAHLVTLPVIVLPTTSFPCPFLELLKCGNRSLGPTEIPSPKCERGWPYAERWRCY